MEPDETLWEYQCRINFETQDVGDSDEGTVLGELWDDLQEGDGYAVDSK